MLVFHFGRCFLTLIFNMCYAERNRTCMYVLTVFVCARVCISCLRLKSSLSCTCFCFYHFLYITVLTCCTVFFIILSLSVSPFSLSYCPYLLHHFFCLTVLTCFTTFFILLSCFTTFFILLSCFTIFCMLLSLPVSPFSFLLAGNSVLPYWTEVRHNLMLLVTIFCGWCLLYTGKGREGKGEEVGERGRG